MNTKRISQAHQTRGKKPLRKPFLDQLAGLGWEVIDLDNKHCPSDTYREIFPSQDRASWSPFTERCWRKHSGIAGWPWNVKSRYYVFRLSRVKTRPLCFPKFPLTRVSIDTIVYKKVSIDTQRALMI